MLIFTDFNDPSEWNLEALKNIARDLNIGTWGDVNSLCSRIAKKLKPKDSTD